MIDIVEQRFAELANAFSVIEIIALVFLLAIVSETVWDFARKKRTGVGETAANFLIAVGNQLLERSVFGFVFVFGLLLAEPFSVTRVPDAWWTWPLAVLVADFTYYWMHRFEHEVRILWAYHSVHHSSPEFNLTTALRLAWIEGFVEWIFFVPMILIGFDTAQTVLALLIVVTYQTWIHTEKIGRLGWLDGLFNTPSVHRVHHGCNRRYLDRNYGGILIVWDRLFGTYQREEEPVIYGIKPTVGSVNPITINIREFSKIVRDVAGARNLRTAIGYIFNRPGWVPPHSDADPS